MREDTTLSADYKIPVPESVRAEYGWEVGQDFAFVPSDGGVMLVPVPTREQLAGSMKGADPTNYRDRNDRY
ncbi:AbrB/MazE/SpoVT family DNA-binding domain-containing protein [Aureimonas leprariae]|uniref:AbrB/MazE/SpoVT family DNA-binding domain-containing protein n=1 Tax=Plantimonas leprariae TaxID=2615207 RepID=A0A7V7TXD2_9HYPH|nr:AbrB/MazE/SpoVT family DNA-binding domain-containing protein [Aureimonas leprariae]KAB0681206.1 AbrB/MazE/SpoVT family DNA-binding domain-containing protein [Aureimonas leprariae]